MTKLFHTIPCLFFKFYTFYYFDFINMQKLVLYNIEIEKVLSLDQGNGGILLRKEKVLIKELTVNKD